MNGTKHYTACPVCNSTAINPLLTVKDYTVSGEQFVIWQCDQCTLRFTQDVPDEASIGKYYKSSEYISHSNTSKGLLNATYQKVRSFTLTQKAKLIESFTKSNNGNLLDVGCGTGSFLHVMKERGWQVTGIEPDEDARKIAQDLYKLKIDEPSALNNLPKDNYQAITLWHVLEHVHDLHNYIESLKSLIKKEGKIFIAVPNYQSLDADEYGSFWAAYDVPRHLYHFTPKAIETLMQQHGLNVIGKKPMWFDSYYISLLSNKYKKGSAGWISALINGTRSNLKTLGNTDKSSSIIYIISKDQ